MKNIFVGNLDFQVTEDVVQSMFEAYGTVERVNLITDRDSGQAKGFGFVEMTTETDAERAIAGLNGKHVGGKVLKVAEALPKTEHTSIAGGRRRNNNQRP